MREALTPAAEDIQDLTDEYMANRQPEESLQDYYRRTREISSEDQRNSLDAENRALKLASSIGKRLQQALGGLFSRRKDTRASAHWGNSPRY